MLVLEDLKEINNVIKELAEFIQNNDAVKPDFEEYLKTIGNMNFQSACFTYIFERNLDNKSILTLYLENNKEISAQT
jgi:hypothetical protein